MVATKSSHPTQSVGSSRTELSTIFIAVLLLQIGGGAVLSTGFIASVFILYKFNVLKYARRNIAIITFVTLTFSLNALFYLNDEDFGSIISRNIRMGIVASLMIVAARSGDIVFDSIFKYKRLFNFILLVLFIVSLIQYIAIYFNLPSIVFLPWEWYGGTAGIDEITGLGKTTLPSYWIEFASDRNLLLGQEFFLRPTVFYAEPSYVAFISFSLLVATYFLEKNKINWSTYFLSLATMFLCSTASGVLVVIGLGIILYRNSSSGNSGHLKLVLIAVVATIIATITVGDRLINLTNIDLEASGFIRLIKPLYNIHELISSGNFLGIPAFVATEYFSPFHNNTYVGSGLDNGVLNMPIYLGIFCVPIIFLLLKEPGIGIFFLIFSSFNGNTFG